MDNYPFLRPRLTPVQPRPAEDTIMNIPCRTVFYRTFDRVLAAFETVMTFQVAYGASVVLGSVLLQTSPERGLSGGQMEAFLRTMKDVERQPQVLHLPAPHIWQLTPSLASYNNCIHIPSHHPAHGRNPKNPSNPS